MFYAFIEDLCNISELDFNTIENWSMDTQRIYAAGYRFIVPVFFNRFFDGVK